MSAAPPEVTRSDTLTLRPFMSDICGIVVTGPLQFPARVFISWKVLSASDFGAPGFSACEAGNEFEAKDLIFGRAGKRIASGSTTKTGCNRSLFLMNIISLWTGG